jgi:hypothetical protein
VLAAGGCGVGERDGTARPLVRLGVAPGFSQRAGRFDISPLETN